MALIEILPGMPREDMRLNTCITRRGTETRPVICWMPVSPDLDGVRYALRQHLGDIPEVNEIREQWVNAKRVNGELVRSQHVVYSDPAQRIVAVYATPRGILSSGYASG